MRGREFCVSCHYFVLDRFLFVSDNIDDNVVTGCPKLFRSN